MLKNLKSLRMEFGISQQRLAEAIYVTQPSINKYENHNSEPEIEILKRMADYFGTTIDYIVGYSDRRYPPEQDEACRLDPDEVKLIETYRRASPEEKSCLRETARLFADSRGNR